MTPRALAWALLAAAMLPALWSFWTQRDVPHFGFLLDDAVYHASAKSLASGGGYRIESLPGGPAQTKYPPGYAAMLALVWRFGGGFPDHLGWALLLNAIAFAVYCLVLMPRLFRELGIEGPWDLILAATVAVNPPSIFYAVSLLTETVAGVVLVFTLLTAANRPWAGGLAAAASLLIRTASIVLLAAAPLWYAMRRKGWRPAIAFLAASLPFALAWTLWSTTHRVRGVTPELRFYVDYFGYLLASLRDSDWQTVVSANFGTLVASTGSLLWFEPANTLGANYGKTLVTLLALAGIVKQIQARGFPLYVLFAIPYTALLLPWNFSPNERFLLPLLPLLTAGIFTTMRGIIEAMTALWRKSGFANRAFAALVLAGLAVAGVFWMQAQAGATFTYFPSLFERQRERNASEATALDWVRRNLPADAAAIAFQESRFYLFTGRRAIGMPLPSRLGYGQDRAAILAHFEDPAEVARANGVRYLYVTPWDFELDLTGSERLVRAESLRRNPGWRPLYAASGFAVYQLQ